MFLAGAPQPQVIEGVSFPAPTAGVNAVDSLGNMQIGDCVFCYNMIPSQYGLKVRRGYEEHVTGLTGTDGVRTFVPYRSPSGSGDALFALTRNGFWDVTISDPTPTIHTSFSTTTGLAGYATWTNFTTIADSYIALCDEVNGYYLYDGSTWTAVPVGGGAGQVSNVDPDELVFVVAWKGQLLFARRNTAEMWYLPVGQITGAAAKFDFGTRFKHGGYLIGLYNWTIDGGEGIDDYLVALSSQGDVIVMKGTNPAPQAAFGIHGQWYVGGFPAGRRAASMNGGDLLLITTNGVIPISQLVAGNEAFVSAGQTTRRISFVVNSLLRSTKDSLGWEITLLPQDDLLMLTSPKQSGQPYLQFVQSLTTQAWYFYRDLPCFTGVAWNNEFYFGDSSGTVYVHTGSLDDVAIDASSSEPVSFSLLSSFQGLNSPTSYKEVEFLRPVFLAAGSPNYAIKAVYDYDLTEILPNPGSPSGGDSWDVGLWDSAIWGGSQERLDPVSGGSGLGRRIAFALRGECTGPLTLIEVEMLLQTGNHL